MPNHGLVARRSALLIAVVALTACTPASIPTASPSPDSSLAPTTTPPPAPSTLPATSRPSTPAATVTRAVTAVLPATATPRAEVGEDFWSLREDVWERIDFAGPGTRSHFGMAYDTTENALYMFGGAKTSSSFSSLTDETWVLTGGEWQQLAPATTPGARGSAALAYDPVRERLVLYGGFSPDGAELFDTWEWGGHAWGCLSGCV